MTVNYLTENPSQTQKTGKIFAKEVLNSDLLKRAFIFGLVGDLGGGKTTFLQGFARGLGIKEKVLSPTFIIMRRFKLSGRPGKFKNFYHIDCYRIKNAEELLNLGFKEIVSDSRNIVAVEWAEKIRKILPRDTVFFNFEFVDKNKRKIVLKIKNGK